MPFSDFHATTHARLPAIDDATPPFRTGPDRRRRQMGTASSADRDAYEFQGSSSSTPSLPTVTTGVAANAAMVTSGTSPLLTIWWSMPAGSTNVESGPNSMIWSLASVWSEEFARHSAAHIAAE